MNEQIFQITDTLYPSVNYKGSVKIVYVDPNTGKTRKLKKKNSGGIGLFTAISRLLAGMNTAEYLPSYIMGFLNENATLKAFSTNIGYASAPILFKSNVGSTADSPAASGEQADIVQYTFMIPASSLTSNKNTIRILNLYNNKNQICASLTFSEEEAISTDIKSNILIYWKLKFAAMSEEAN